MTRIEKKSTILFGLKEYLFVSILLFILIFKGGSLPYLSLITGLIFFTFYSFIYGYWFFSENSYLIKFILGSLIILSLVSFSGTLAFYLYKIDDLTFNLQLYLIAALPFFYFLFKKIKLTTNQESLLRQNGIITNLINFFFVLSYLLIVSYLFYLIINVSTTESLRSPWEIIPKKFFLLYFLATFILITKIVIQPKKTLFLIILHFFLSFSIAFFVYQIASDYDSFIHRQNEFIIYKTGTLIPKPFYYLGQYAQIIFIQKILNFSLPLIDKLLLPTLAALTIPTVLITAFKENYKIDDRYLNLLPLTFLILPFTNFIITTPQGLANLLSLIIIFLSLSVLHKNNQNIWLIIFLAVVTIAIHPLTGLPILFFVILLAFYLHFQKKFFLPGFLTKSIFFELVLIFLLSLPAAFLINSNTTSQMKVLINENFVNYFFNFFKDFKLDFFYRPFITIYDLIYTYSNNLTLLIALLTIYGLIFIISRKKFKKYFIYFLTFLILFINYLFLKSFFLFNSLINYERNNYPQRILELSLFFLLPFFLIALYQIFDRLLKSKLVLSLLITILLSLTITVSLYLSYPRFDPISESHGYSTSATDLKTVNFLDKLNKNKDYIVLAAQPVSAAAIQELGFKKYYQGYFFYPVPTGNKLYEYYLDLAYDKRDTWEIIKDVKNLTKVNNIYLVINDYWWAAEDVIEKQKNLATNWFSIDGKNYIFKYEL